MEIDNSFLFIFYKKIFKSNITKPKYSHKVESSNWGFFSSYPLSNQRYLIGNPQPSGDNFSLQINFDDKNTVHFLTDSISSIPLFYGEFGNIKIVSNSLGVIIDTLKANNIAIELNLSVCSEIIISSYIFSPEYTQIKNIKRLEPNSLLSIVLSDGSFSKNSYENYDFDYQHSRLSKRDLANELETSLINGLKKYQNSKVGVLLSGGADSRLIASSAIKANISPQFITFGQSTVNSSDFLIGNHVAKALNSETQCFTASAKNFKKNWKIFSEKLNWSGDQIWYFAKLPNDFYSTINSFDVVLRGDGDGVFGWKGKVGSLDDVLHTLEISSVGSLEPYLDIFTNKKHFIKIASIARESVFMKYKDGLDSLESTKNKLYKVLREYGCISPSINFLSHWTNIDSPLMWKKSIDIASMLPKNYRSNKKIIFDILAKENKFSNIPYSRGPSWNNQLEFFYSGVNEELIDYICKWSPWEIDRSILRQKFLNLPPIPNELRCTSSVSGSIKNYLKERPFIRRYILKNRPDLFYTSFSERGLIRLAVISSLNERVKS